MHWQIKSIRGKLLLSFLMFLLVTCAIVVLNVWLNNRRAEVTRLNAKLTLINLDVQRLKRTEGDFLKDEIINPNFYNTQQSRYLNEHQQSLAEIRESLYDIQNHAEVNSEEILQKIETVRSKLTSYQHSFHQLQELIIRRGFKDFGLEGRMRYYAHNLEQSVEKYKIDLAKYLTIRRIEKDFILRKEWHYTQDILPAIASFAQEIENRIQNLQEKQKLQKMLEDYKNTFLQIANTEKAIGFNNDAGIRSQLTQYSREIEIGIEKLTTDIASITRNLDTQSISTFVAIIVVAVILLLFFAIFLTQTLSRPIRNLSQSIHYVIEHNFEKNVNFEPLKTQDEIGKLSKDFGLMLQTVQFSIEKIQNQSEKIERKQFALMESLRYAQTIQQAILPDADDFGQYFEEYFTFYKPMHTVSGDFYWLTEQEDLVFLAVVDCTGHGVPGAFMSMVGNALLSKIVNEKEIFDPALILSMLDMEVKQALKQERDKNNDGMEISLCKFEGLTGRQDTIKITFASAKGKCFYTENDILQKQKSTRRSIGGKTEDTQNTLEDFENFEKTLERGEKVYFATDGYCDQPSPKRKKLGTKAFMDILQENIALPLEKQGEILQQKLQMHMQDIHEQRDDITVVGVKL